MKCTSAAMHVCGFLVPGGRDTLLVLVAELSSANLWADISCDYVSHPKEQYSFFVYLNICAVAIV